MLLSPLSADLTQLHTLWKDVFGDEDGYIDLFFSGAYFSSHPFAVVGDGEVRSVLYLLDCSLQSGGKLYDGYYLYAAATKPQYLGINSIIARCTYHGRTKTYDRKFANIVARTADVSGDMILDDPVVDLELEVDDVSSSLLDMAIALALNVVREWDQVTITERGPEGKSAYRVAVDNGFVGTEEEWLDSLVGATGPRGPRGYPTEVVNTRYGGGATAAWSAEQGKLLAEDVIYPGEVVEEV